MVQLIGKKAMNYVVSHLEGVKDAVYDEAKAGGRRAEANLAAERASTRWSRITPKGYYPASIEVTRGDVDSFFSLEAPNAMALEFGHAPSGVFGPGGALSHIETKAPEGTYILTRATRMA